MVLPGFSPTLAKFFRCRTLFITEDFPTLDFPAKAISGSLAFGKSLADAAEIKKSTLLKFIVVISFPVRSFEEIITQKRLTSKQYLKNRRKNT